MWSEVRSLMRSLSNRFEDAQLRLLMMRPTQAQAFTITALFFGVVSSLPHYSHRYPSELQPFDPVRGVIMGTVFGLMVAAFVKPKEEDD